jgi:hypothetical protein
MLLAWRRAKGDSDSLRKRAFVHVRVCVCVCACVCVCVCVCVCGTKSCSLPLCSVQPRAISIAVTSLRYSDGSLCLHSLRKLCQAVRDLRRRTRSESTSFDPSALYTIFLFQPHADTVLRVTFALYTKPHTDTVFRVTLCWFIFFTSCT